MLDRVRLFSELEDSRRILIAGAGGGFDVYAGVPLYAALRRRGCEVFFGNLTFTHLGAVKAETLTPACMEISATTRGPDGYFPERSLAAFLSAQGLGTRVFAFDNAGVVAVREAYAHLVDELQLDTIVLVDGGTDILMRGDEQGLGTPGEDMTSLAAVARVDVARKVVCCLGFGVDAFHGVHHAQFLENVASLSRRDGYWGAFAVTADMPEAQLYLAAVAHAAEQTKRRSIVNGSIADAIEGKYGDVHRHPERTRNSTLWINPLMAMYWSFDLAAVVVEHLYLDDLMDATSASEVFARISAARYRIPRREGPLQIPV